MFQLGVVYQTRLLLYHVPTREDHKIRDTLNMESRRKLSILLRVDF